MLQFCKNSNKKIVNYSDSIKLILYFIKENSPIFSKTNFVKNICAETNYVRTNSVFTN
jgi:hypothetical protein